MSMNPGVTTYPVTSRTRAPSGAWAPGLSTPRTRPSAMRTSAANRGPPRPSMTSPPRNTHRSASSFTVSTLLSPLAQGCSHGLLDDLGLARLQQVGREPQPAGDAGGQLRQHADPGPAPGPRL